MEFLKQLRAQLKRKLLIIWDGRPAHRSRLVRDYIDSTNGTLQIEQLPAYAPELNPVEFRGRTGSSTSWRISARKISPNSRIRS